MSGQVNFKTQSFFNSRVAEVAAAGERRDLPPEKKQKIVGGISLFDIRIDFPLMIH